MKLDHRRTILVGLAFLSICSFWQMYDSVIPKILTETFRLNETISGAIMALDNILALFLLPLFGALSDRTSTKIGRRMPFILLGTACAAVLMNLLPVLDNRYAAPTDTVDTVHEEIRRRVYATRHEQKLNTTDNSMDILNKLPRFLSKAAIRFIRWLDRHGWCPDGLIGDDPNYASVFLSNLGSIRLRSGYHHLTNWGTCSFFCVIGEKKWTPLYDQNGLVAMRETVDLGFTVDERIADGYYYSKSIRLFKHLLAHPELLELPFEQEVDYD